jgi:hypothetical protein
MTSKVLVIVKDLKGLFDEAGLLIINEKVKLSSERFALNLENQDRLSIKRLRRIRVLDRKMRALDYPWRDLQKMRKYYLGSAFFSPLFRRWKRL